MKQAIPIRLPDGSEVYEDYQPLQKKGWLTSIKEKFIGESNTTPAQVVNPKLFSYLGERPETEFATMFYYFERTPQLQTAVFNYIDRIFGTEIQVNSENQSIKDFLEDWNRKVHAHEKFVETGTTTLICGSCLLEKLDEKTIQDIKPVKMSTILGKKRDKYNLKVEYYKQRLNDGSFDELGKGLPDARQRFIEFNINYYDQNDWGRSLFYSLAVPRSLPGYDDPIKPLIQVMWQVEEAMGNIFTNHSEPMKYITYAGANKEFIDNQALAFKKRKVGSTFFGDRKPEIDIIEATGNSKYGEFVEHLEKAFELGTQFPHDIMTGDFTSRASSETTDDAIDKRIKSFQTRFLTRLMDELYIPLLKANGYSDLQIRKSNLVLQFGTPSQQELSVQEIMTVRQNKDLSRWEVRQYLKNNTGMDMDDQTLEDEEADNLQKQQDMFNQKLQLSKLSPQNGKNEETPQDVGVTKEKKVRKCESCKEGQCTFCSKKSCKCKH